MHVRNVRPWEIEDKDGRVRPKREKPVGDEEAGWKDFNVLYDDTKSKWPVKMEIFGAANKYEGEEWVSKYPKLALWKQISNRKIMVKTGGGLGDIQDKMIRQAEAWALIITIPLTVGFCCIPSGNFF